MAQRAARVGDFEFSAVGRIVSVFQHVPVEEKAAAAEEEDDQSNKERPYQPLDVKDVEPIARGFCVGAIAVHPQLPLLALAEKQQRDGYVSKCNIVRLYRVVDGWPGLRDGDSFQLVRTLRLDHHSSGSSSTSSDYNSDIDGGDGDAALDRAAAVLRSTTASGSYAAPGDGYSLFGGQGLGAQAVSDSRFDPRALAFSPDGSVLAATRGALSSEASVPPELGFIRLWRMGSSSSRTSSSGGGGGGGGCTMATTITATAAATTADNAPLGHMAFSPCGSLLAVASLHVGAVSAGRGGGEVTSAAAAAAPATNSRHTQSRIYLFDVSPFASSSPAAPPKQIHVISLVVPVPFAVKASRFFMPSPAASDQQVSGLFFTPDGRRLICLFSGGSVAVHCVATATTVGINNSLADGSLPLALDSSATEPAAALSPMGCAPFRLAIFCRETRDMTAAHRIAFFDPLSGSLDFDAPKEMTALCAAPEDQKTTAAGLKTIGVDPNGRFVVCGGGSLSRAEMVLLETVPASHNTAVVDRPWRFRSCGNTACLSHYGGRARVRFLNGAPSLRGSLGLFISSADNDTRLFAILPRGTLLYASETTTRRRFGSPISIPAEVTSLEVSQP